MVPAQQVEQQTGEPLEEQTVAEAIHTAGVVQTRGDWSMEVDKAQAILAASATMAQPEQKTAACQQAQTFALVAIAKSLERMAAKG